jgi:hypothetical protein
MNFCFLKPSITICVWLLSLLPLQAQFAHAIRVNAIHIGNLATMLRDNNHGIGMSFNYTRLRDTALRVFNKPLHYTGRYEYVYARASNTNKFVTLNTPNKDKGEYTIRSNCHRLEFGLEQNAVVLGKRLSLVSSAKLGVTYMEIVHTIRLLEELEGYRNNRIVIASKISPQISLTTGLNYKVLKNLEINTDLNLMYYPYPFKYEFYKLYSGDYIGRRYEHSKGIVANRILYFNVGLRYQFNIK